MGVRRGFLRFISVFFVFGIVVAACGSGDDSAGPRTRNAGAGPTFEECFGDSREVAGLTEEEYEKLVEADKAARVTLEVVVAAWAEFGSASTTQIGALEELGSLATKRADIRGTLGDEYTEADEASFNEYRELFSRGDELWEQVVSAIEAAFEAQMDLLSAGLLPALLPDESEMEPGSLTDSDAHAETAEVALSEQEDLNFQSDALSDRVAEMNAQLEQDRQTAEEQREALLASEQSTNAALANVLGVAALETQQSLYLDENGGLVFGSEGGLENWWQWLEEVDVGSNENAEEFNNLILELEKPEIELFFDAADAQEEVSELENQLLALQQGLGEANQAAIENQGAAIEDWGAATQNQTNFAANDDPCEGLAAEVSADLTEDALWLLAELRENFAPAVVPPVQETAVNQDETAVNLGTSVSVNAVPVGSDDSQAQLPTIVVIADEPTVEIQEIVDEIVVTPAAAQTMLNNAGVYAGSVEVKTSDGNWQTVPSTKPLVVPIAAADNDVEIRVVEEGASEAALTQTVALQRVPTQELLSAEQLAALLPVASEDDSSSLMWLLYVVIGVLAIAVAFLFGQRRKASAS